MIKEDMAGNLYLFPTFLDAEWNTQTISQVQLNLIPEIALFLAENPKTCRRHLKKMCPDLNIQEIKVIGWSKHGATEDELAWTYLKKGLHVAIMSEAGCPGLADPGAEWVAKAHARGFKVLPMVGPSAFVLALMGSGFSGQSFHFHGYLPREEKPLQQHIKSLEKTANHTTHIWMETPYRNHKHFEVILGCLKPESNLCLAYDLLSQAGWIKTKTIAEWKKGRPSLEKRPMVFLIGSKPG